MSSKIAQVLVSLSIDGFKDNINLFDAEERDIIYKVKISVDFESFSRHIKKDQINTCKINQTPYGYSGVSWCLADKVDEIIKTIKDKITKSVIQDKERIQKFLNFIESEA